MNAHIVPGVFALFLLFPVPDCGFSEDIGSVAKIFIPMCTSARYRSGSGGGVAIILVFPAGSSFDPYWRCALLLDKLLLVYETVTQHNPPKRQRSPNVESFPGEIHTRQDEAEDWPCLGPPADPSFFLHSTSAHAISRASRGHC